MRTILVSAAGIVGVAIGVLSHLPAWPLLPSAGLALVGAALARRSVVWCTFGLIVAAASLGCLRASFPPLVAPIGVDPLKESRSAAEAAIRGNLPEPQASLAAGVLLGGSGQLDATFRSDLRRSGLAHLVAIDGFKQVVVAAVVGGWTVSLIGARIGALASLGAIVGYTLLTGAHPSAVRAALMAGLATLAAATGRVADPLTSLTVAVLLMALAEPLVLFDLGLQLSLSATLGIVLFWPWLWRRLRRWPRAVAEPIGLTLAVTLGTMPVTLSAFQQVSLVSPLAHVLAVPLLPAVLVGAALLAACAPLGPLSSIVAWLVWLPTTALEWVIRAFGSLPGAALSTGRPPAWTALTLAVVLLVWGLSNLPELRGTRLRLVRAISSSRRVAAPVACIGVCLSTAALASLLRPDGRVHIDALNVSRGQAVFVRGPTGRTALLVAGRADALALSSQLADRLAVWEHRVDIAISFDPGADNALKLALARYPASEFVHRRAPTELDVGGGVVLAVETLNGSLSVRSAPTTSAARPGSAD